jgi:hypothetical protein
MRVCFTAKSLKSCFRLERLASEVLLWERSASSPQPAYRSRIDFCDVPSFSVKTSVLPTSPLSPMLACEYLDLLTEHMDT